MFDYDAHTCDRLHEKLTDLKPCAARRLGKCASMPNFRMFAFAFFWVACIGSVAVILVDNSEGGRHGTMTGLEPTHFVDPGDQSRQFMDGYQRAFDKYENYLGKFIF